MAGRLGHAGIEANSLKGVRLLNPSDFKRLVDRQLGSSWHRAFRRACRPHARVAHARCLPFHRQHLGDAGQSGRSPTPCGLEPKPVHSRTTVRLETDADTVQRRTKGSALENTQQQA